MSRNVFSDPWKKPDLDSEQLDTSLSLSGAIVEEIVYEASVPQIQLPQRPLNVTVAPLDEVLTSPELAIEARRRVEEAYNATPSNFTYLQ